MIEFVRNRVIHRLSLFVMMITALCVQPSSSFGIVTKSAIRKPLCCRSSLDSSSIDSTSGTSSLTNEQILSLALEKPLGIMLEEVTDEQGQPKGVAVKDFADTGSALAYPDIKGAALARVGGIDVATKDFDAVMELIASATGTVELDFMLKSKPVEYAVGHKVTLTVQQQNGPDLIIDTAVGDNLRQVLIDNGFEVYQGLKQKLGNCGGAGQCTFCAVDFIETGDGWLERSEYEDKKLSKFPVARLACLNTIQGPATIRKTER